jgi:hypothetical protein
MRDDIYDIYVKIFKFKKKHGKIIGWINAAIASYLRNVSNRLPNLNIFTLKTI